MTPLIQKGAIVAASGYTRSEKPRHPMPATEILALAPFIALSGYVVFGVSGFGSTLVSVPLLVVSGASLIVRALGN